MQTIQNLTIEKEIGKGNHGVVYLAHDINQNKYAIKVLNHVNDYAAQRFKNEHFTMNSLDHEGIIKVYGTGVTDDGRHYMIMEYFEGRSLRDILRDENVKLKLKTKVRVMKNIALALGVAHKANIVHRDIKPSNILIDLKKDQIRITDFGIALLPESTLTQAIDILGTPGYLSPEGFQNPKVCPASDVYSLGAIAYEFFLGQPVFDLKRIRKVHELGFKTITENPLSPHKINRKFPANLAKVLEKMLKKQPEKRYKNGFTVAEALDNILKNGFTKTRFLIRQRWCTKKG